MRLRTIYLLTALTALLLLPLTASAQQQESATGGSIEASVRQELIQERLREIWKEKVLSHQQDHHADAAPSLQKGALLGSEKIISSRAEAEGEVHAAINPTDTNNIVTSVITGGAAGGLTLPIYYTTDFGATWQQSDFLPGAQFGGGDPVFTFGPDGTLHFSWIALGLSSTGENNFDLLAASSPDGGATWSEVDTVFHGILSFSSTGLIGDIADKQWMTVDHSDSPYRNTVYTVFLEVHAAEQPSENFSRIAVRKRLPATGRYEQTSVAISDPDHLDIQFAGIDVDHEGTIHVFFWGSKSTASTHTSLWHALSTDGGATFTKAREIAPVRFPRNETSPGSPGASIPSYLPQRLAVFPQFAVDNHPESERQGSLYAVWTSNELGSDEEATYDEPFHVYFCSSDDGGNTWSEPTRINDDFDLEYRADHFLPSIDVTPDGVVVVTWYDGRAAANNKDLHYYAAYSFDGGNTFTKNFRVTETGSDIETHGDFGVGDYVKTISTRGYAIPFWSDGRSNDGNMDLYAAFIPITPQVSSVRTRLLSVGNAAALLDITPNPIASDARVHFSLKRAGEVHLEILSTTGKVLSTIAARNFEAGIHEVPLDAETLPSGTYFCRLRFDGITRTMPFSVIR